MLDHFICGLEPIICHEFSKDNPQTFKEACVIAKQILWLANFVGVGGTCSKWHKPPDYTLMELDSMGTHEHPYQADKGGKNNQTNKPRPTCFCKFLPNLKYHTWIN